MADSGRARKVAERIKDTIAEKLDAVVKDPDLGFVTITDVRVTGDVQHASVFYTVFGDADQRARTAKLLSANTGRLRSLVGKHLGIRLTPSLEFIADALPENASHLEELVRAARAHDAEVAASAAGAAFAGEADLPEQVRALAVRLTAALYALFAVLSLAGWLDQPRCRGQGALSRGNAQGGACRNLGPHGDRRARPRHRQSDEITDLPRRCGQGV